MNVIPLRQTKTADTAHMEIFASVTRPFPKFWSEPGDEVSVEMWEVIEREGE